MTAAQLRGIIKGIVEAHVTHNAFYSIWSDVKDRETELTYPCAIWDQWRARLDEDENGQMRRTVIVRLLVVTAVPTDRTPGQRDGAVEAADEAATAYVLKLRVDYPDLKVSDVSTTTQYDEYTQLETGVLLTMTVQGEGLCLDADDFAPPSPDCLPSELYLNGVLVRTVPSGGTENVPVLQGGVPVGELIDGEWIIPPCESENCEDSHVQVNGVPVIDLPSGSTWDLHVQDEGGNAVGSWDPYGERWVVPSPPPQNWYWKLNAIGA